MLTEQLMPESEGNIISFIRVFVYGTLKPGEENYPRYCAGKLAVNTGYSFENQPLPAYTNGQLFDLPVGYPGMAVGSNPVYGYLLNFREPSILRELDELEDYVPDRSPSQNLYNRDRVEVFHPQGQKLGSAWAYLMSLDNIYRLKGVLLTSGWWSGCGLRMEDCFGFCKNNGSS